MKFVIAGLGSIGRRHLRNLVRLGQRDIVLLRTFQSPLSDDELAGFPVATKVEEALSHRPDAVIIANPTALHMDVALPSAEAGCHILIEKPVSNRLEQVSPLREAMKKSGAKLLVGFHFRFHPHFQHTRELLKKAAIGEILSARAHYGDYLPGWHPWEDYRKSYSAREELGGGVLLTLCHPLDYFMWFFGDAVPLWRTTKKLSPLDIAVDDFAELGFRFAGGGIGSVHLDYYQRPPAHRFEILGTEGTIRWDQDDNTLRVFSAASGTWNSIPGPTGFDRNDMFLSEMSHFLEVIQGNASPVCPLEEGERVLRLALAADPPGEGPLSERRRGRAFPEKVSAVVFDFDGVMTDNRAWVDERGLEQVAVNRSDGLGIAMLRQEGQVEILVLSTETNATVSARCRKLGIPVLQGLADKASVLKTWMEEHDVDPARVVYAGNDVNDLPCFGLVGFTFAPADAHPEVLRCADYILKNPGGQGAVREICDFLLSSRRSL